MTDLIHRSEVERIITEAIVDQDNRMSKLKERIAEIPEGVVRCRDCKHYGRVDKRRFYRGADCLKGYIKTIVPENDYCSRGERRDDG